MATDFSKYGSPVTQAEPSTTSSLSKYGIVVSTTQTQPQEPLHQSIWSRLSSFSNVPGFSGAIDTLSTNFANLTNAGAGLLNAPAAFFGNQQAMQRLDQSIARSKALPKSTLEQNVGTGLQLAPLILGGAAGAPATVAKNAVLGTLYGASSGAGQAMTENKSALDVAKKGALGGAVGGTISGVTALAGKFLEGTGDKIQYSVIKPTKSDIEDGFSIDTVKNYNLGGSLNAVFKKTESKLDDLTSQLNDKLASSDATINLADVYQKTAERLSSGKLSSFGTNTSFDAALEQLKNEVANVGTDLSVPEAQIVKRAAGHYGAWQYGMFDPDSTARQKVYNVFYNELKKAIESASPEGVKEINKQMSELIPVLNAVIRRIPIAERNNAISLSDVIGLVGSAINPKALGFTLLNFLSKSGYVGNALSRFGQTVTSAAPVAGAIGSTVIPTGVESAYTTQPTQSQR